MHVQIKEGYCFLVYSVYLCSNQAGGCFLVYFVTFIIRNMCVQIKRNAALLVYPITFVTQTKSAGSKQAGGCFLV